jgi:hypothetical protein
MEVSWLGFSLGKLSGSTAQVVQATGKIGKGVQKGSIFSKD